MRGRDQESTEFFAARRTVLTRLFLDARHRRRAKEYPVAVLPEQSVAPDHSSHERMAMQAALLAVPPGQRAVLVLRYVADLSVEQVAATLGCSTGNVKSQTVRGLAALREAYPGDNTAARKA
ncbi:sigma-70 family RNA polymerase sigma factor [Actinophytocola sp.]|uniref:sigma-70 family RNA polymerase sigma factor n=1 Tax=Actinophytocola sp. TaxID=1872138 RepID=UPI003D6B6E06